MTETQKRFLISYLGECDHEESPLRTYKCSKCGKWNYEFRRLKFDAQDKQDLLEAIDKNGEWDEFEACADTTHYFLKPSKTNWIADSTLTKWLVLLSPEETAELICKWKGVE